MERCFAQEPKTNLPPEKFEGYEVNGFFLKKAKAFLYPGVVILP